jgi:hypothetical protein
VDLLEEILGSRAKRLLKLESSGRKLRKQEVPYPSQIVIHDSLVVSV